MKHTLLMLLASLAILSCNDVVQPQQKEQKIVSIGGTTTEILYALNKGKDLVGVDITSTYPKEVAALSQLGHSSRISAEAVLSTGANTLIGLKKDVPQHLEQTLENSGVNCMLLDLEYSKAGTEHLLIALADSLDRKELGAALVVNLNKDFKTLAVFENKPKVLFVYARGAGTLLVAGKNTPLDAMISMAGGENAAATFEGFKPLNAEAIVSAAPDVLLMFDSGLKSLEGDAIQQIPGLSLTPAGKTGKVISMNSQLLSGFGPRLALAVKELAEKIHS